MLWDSHAQPQVEKHGITACRLKNIAVQDTKKSRSLSKNSEMSKELSKSGGRGEREKAHPVG